MSVSLEKKGFSNFPAARFPNPAKATAAPRCLAREGCATAGLVFVQSENLVQDMLLASS